VTPLALLALAGCSVAKRTAQLPLQAAGAVVPGKPSGQPDVSLLQLEVQRFADDFVARTTIAIDEYADRVGTDAARLQGLSWKLTMAAAVFSIASEPNPNSSLVDLLGVSMRSRVALEEHWVKGPEGAAFEPWLETSRLLETNAWKMVEVFFDPKQQRELRDALIRWHAAEPPDQMGFFARQQEFTAVVRKDFERAPQPGSLFSLVGLDPTAGLDPAVREVTRTRLFAERALYAVQRMPHVLRLQVELLTERMIQREQLAQALVDVTRLSQSADRLSRVSETAVEIVKPLPDRLTAEREAIIAAFTQQEGALLKLSEEVGRTMREAEGMADSFNATLTTFTQLMNQFGVGDRESTASPNPSSAPFNILDYAHTAEQLSVAARDLDVLIKDLSTTLESPALDRRVEQASALANQTKTGAKSVLNHGFFLGAGLILLAFVCAVAYRGLFSRRAAMRSTEARAGGDAPLRD
jgi:hypothetical protein